MYKSISNPKILEPYPDALLFAEAWNGHAFPWHPPDHTRVFDRATTSIRISFIICSMTTPECRSSAWMVCC